MIVTVTSLRLKSLWGFFRLSWWGFKISLQARKSKGFVKMKNTGFGYMHYTASVWQTPEDAKAFAHSGPHMEAIKQSKLFSSEVRILSYPGDSMPPWKEAKALLTEKGRVY